MCSTRNDNIRDVILDCLNQQLSEFELLESMYPNKDEIILTDNNIICEITNFLTTDSEYTPSNLDFTLNLRIDSLKLEMCINLPTMYPKEEPEIYIRCNQFNRQQETHLNTDLSNFIRSNQMGEVCLYNAISWLQDNIDNYKHPIEMVSQQKSELNKKVDKNIRLWIYSHHIYNKKKREEIVKKAGELKLTGFCLTGKPGIVCIEGPNADCYEWWKDIKSMSWKKNVIRKTEDFDKLEDRIFANFEEIHLKMNEFSKYMDKYGLSDTFNYIFKLCNE